MGEPIQTTNHWLADIPKQGLSPFHPLGHDYKVFRNVKDYGAHGDGEHDDTDAINAAITDGARCGGGGKDQDSSTVSPAVVYFPPGTYKVTAPIVSYYYTSIVGDAKNKPTLKAGANFKGAAVIDENPYIPNGWGRTWYTPQNNFFRSVAHLNIDITEAWPQHGPDHEYAAIHHQVAQATGLRHVHFEMRPYDPDAEQPGQMGVRMENGSGGYMSNLSFRGGEMGIWAGNQQFTVQDCHFANCRKAISQHWCWTFVYHKLSIVDCQVGIEVRVYGGNAACSIALIDSSISNTPTGVDIVHDHFHAKGSIVLSNVETQGVFAIVQRSMREFGPKTTADAEYFVLLAPDVRSDEAVIANWTWQGDVPTYGQDLAADLRTGPLKLDRPVNLLDRRGRWLHRPRPEYEDQTASAFISVRKYGACGDGIADDTAALQHALYDAARTGKIVWVPHGHYLVTHTLVIPPSIRMVGEVWPVFLGTGAFFDDDTTPRPVIQVGEHAGQAGFVEVSECIFSTRGPCRGAIVLLWNLKHADTSCMPGMWDTHIRLGGFKGSALEDSRFDSHQPLNTVEGHACFLAWHISPQASGCFVNTWVWLADHMLDSSPGRDAGKQISILAARGILIESDPGPVCLWGGASEHFVLYQYQLARAKNVLIAHAQTESPYFLGSGQPLPHDLVRTDTHHWGDPTWHAKEEGGTLDAFDARSWGMRIVQSSSAVIIGAGLYSFFDAYSLAKLEARQCQRALLSIEGDASQVDLINLNTVGVQSMLDVEGREVVHEGRHRAGTASTVGYYFHPQKK